MLWFQHRDSLEQDFELHSNFGHKSISKIETQTLGLAKKVYVRQLFSVRQKRWKLLSIGSSHHGMRTATLCVAGNVPRMTKYTWFKLVFCLFEVLIKTRERQQWNKRKNQKK